MDLLKGISSLEEESTNIFIYQISSALKTTLYFPRTHPYPLTLIIHSISPGKLLGIASSFIRYLFFLGYYLLDLHTMADVAVLLLIYDLFFLLDLPLLSQILFLWIHFLVSGKVVVHRHLQFLLCVLEVEFSYYYIETTLPSLSPETPITISALIHPCFLLFLHTGDQIILPKMDCYNFPIKYTSYNTSSFIFTVSQTSVVNYL